MPRPARAHALLSRAEEHLRFEEFWDEPMPTPRTPCGVEALQGGWLALGGRRQAEMLISGSRLTVHFDDGDIYMGSFTLGRSGRLETMDISIEEGPARHKGMSALAIYELDGHTLRWCTASPGQADRPAAFAEPDPLSLFLVFRREHLGNTR